ncbi:MAG: GDP-mannose 6-dehydrogenase [Ignavibacterium sp.]
MRVSIFGLGYVGCVGLGCLAEHGHSVIGVDVDQTKVDLINNCKATIVEKDIDELIEKNKKRISSTVDFKNAVLNSDLAIICVGTPNNEFGHLSMENIYKVAEQIGVALKNDDKEFFTVAIRSTVMPGTNEKVSSIIEEISGLKRDINFGVVSNPEFLREGSAVQDFFNPPYTVVASGSDKAIDVMRELYSKVKGEFIISDISSAELIKFVNNSFHALKVAFGNEVGRICKTLGVDSHTLMNLFVKDTILNISPYYLKPGFAYGGSCLPKDLKALNTIVHDNYLKTPILSSVAESNNQHIDFAYNLIQKHNGNRIGFYGLTFKEGTDDLRFSGALELVERFLGKGYKVSIFDKNISLSRLMGKNKEFLLNKLPHIDETLLENIDQFLKHIDTLVIVNGDDSLREKLTSENQIKIVDLKRIKEFEKLDNYEGICW